MADNAGTARVLTLVFTDLADSTALKTERGDDAVDELITRHREHVARLAEECAGRIIDWAGDGCFLTFETSSAGVLFGLRLQQIHKRDPDLPGVRVGIHLGEVTEKEGPGGLPQVKGLAVDLAARIQSLAKPGQVLLSAAVYDSARQRIGVDALGQPVLWQTHGPYTFKGFDKPLDIGEAGLEGLSPLAAPEASEKAQPLVVHTPDVEVMPPPAPPRRIVPVLVGVMILCGIAFAYWFSQQNAAPASLDDELGPVTSLAVLPLDNLMNDSEQDYFADGMTEAITAELAKIKSLSVVSRTSAMRYKDSPLSMRDIAAELGVEGLIEGSVLRDGDEVRITVQLIDGRSDQHVWSESYTDTVTSVLKLQAKVALAIAGGVRATVTPEEQQQYATRKEVNDEAYDAYLKAWELMGGGNEESALAALEYLKRAQAIDPEMADAWGAEARAHWVLSVFANWPMREQIDKVQTAASRALALDENQFYGHVGMGSYAQVHDRDWDTALRHYHRAAELNPSEPIARFYLGNLHVLLGDWDAGLSQAEEIIRLSGPGSYERALASVMFTMTNDDERAIAMFGDVDPADFPGAPWQLARIYYRAGELENAIRQSKLADDPGIEMLALARGGQRAEALEIIGEIDEEGNHERGSRVRMPDIAAAYVWLDDLDSAYKWLERADVDLSLWLLNVLREAYLDDRINDPRWIAFRNDARYWSFIERLQLPPLPPEHPGYADEQAWLARKAAVNAPIEKIAVLPFDNMSSDEEQEYFVDGMTEALIAELAKVKSIKVISRTSVMQYKDTDKSITEIAAELGVDGLIEGSVMKAGEEVRITAQLVNGRTDEHLWAESYTNTLENVFKLQAEVALAITDEINAVVTPDEQSRIGSAVTVDPEAYRLYAEGRHFWNLRTQSGFERARRLFTQAIELDPDFAMAHVGLADVYVLHPDYGIENATQSVPLAIEAANRALEINPNLGEAYAVLGYAKAVGTFDWAGAEADFERAIELNPGYATAYYWYAYMRQLTGAGEGAVELARNAYQLDPMSPTAVAVYGFALVASQQVEQGLQLFEDTAAIHSDVPVYHILRGLASSHVGDFASAIGYFDQATTIAGIESGAAGMSAAARALNGNPDGARQLVGDVIEIGVGTGLPSLSVAWAYAALGDAESAFQWFERAIDDGQGASAMAFAIGRPFLDSIVDDPRYAELLDRLNLPADGDFR